jgi:hypothetical protein
VLDNLYNALPKVPVLLFRRWAGAFTLLVISTSSQLKAGAFRRREST